MKIVCSVDDHTHKNTSNEINKKQQKQTNFKLCLIPFSFAIHKAHEFVECIDFTLVLRQRCSVCVDITNLDAAGKKIGNVTRKPLKLTQDACCFSVRCYYGSRILDAH